MKSPYLQSDITKNKDLQRLLNRIENKMIVFEVNKRELAKLMAELHELFPPKQSFLRRLFKR